MQLTYRGVNYDLNSDRLTDLRFRSANVRQNEKAKAQSLNAVLTYRGATYQVQSAGETQAAQPAAMGRTLMYRGVGYRIQPIAQPQAKPQPQITVAKAANKAVPLESQVRTLVHNHSYATRQRQQVMLSRAAIAAGLKTDVSAYANQIQGEDSANLWATYDRSRVAFS
jgi:hypothetical protein